jgi:hypothetical protein
MRPISVTTHIKAMFSFSPGTGKHLIGNALCISDDLVTKPFHILHIFTNVLEKSPEYKIQTGQIWRMKGPRNDPTSSQSAIRKFPVQKSNKKWEE